MKQRLFITILFLIPGSLFSAALGLKDIVYESLDLVNLKKDHEIVTSLRSIGDSVKLEKWMITYVYDRPKSPGADFALQQLKGLFSVRSVSDLARIAIRERGEVENLALQVLLQQSQPKRKMKITTMDSKALTQKLLKKIIAKQFSSEMVFGFLKANLPIEDARLILLDEGLESPAKPIALRILMKMESDQLSFNRLAFYLDHNRKEIAQAAFDEWWSAMADSRALLELKKYPIKFKERVLDRMLDFSSRVDSRSLAKKISDIDQDGDLKEALSEYSRFRSGVEVAGGAIVLIHLKSKEDPKKILRNLLEDQNPEVRKNARELLNISGIDSRTTY